MFSRERAGDEAAARAAIRFQPAAKTTPPDQQAHQIASALLGGQIAIIGYNTDDAGTPQDSLTFVLLSAIGSGTQIFFTDRAWNGTSFAAAGGGDGTFTYTALSDLAAGTIITISQSQLSGGGINLSDAGETIYAYQGAINAPTVFLYAADIADANTVFTGSLVNTGLVAGTTAVAVAGDNAHFGDRGHNIQQGDLLSSIGSATNWSSDNNTSQLPPSGNLFNAPDQVIFAALSGDAGLFAAHRDGSDTASLQHAYYQWVDSPLTHFNHPNDIVFDTVHGLFFVADTDTGNRRILQGNIADLFNPGQPPTLTVLWTNPDPATSAGQVNGLAIDYNHNGTQGALYFVNQDDLLRVVYDHDGTSPTNQVPVNLASVPAGQFANEIALDIASGRVWIMSTASSTVPITVPMGTPGAIFDPDSGTWYIVATDVTNNEIYQVSNVARTDTNSAGNTVVALDLNGATADTDLGDLQGLLSSIDVDPVNGFIYFVAGQINNGLNGAVGGVYRYNLSNGTVEILYTETSATDYNFEYIDVDAASGRYYLTNVSFESPGDPNGTSVNTSSIMVHGLSAGAPTLFANTPDMNSAGALGLVILNAPTLTGTAALNLGVTEASNAPGSGNTASVTPFSGLTASDLDTVDGTDELAGAQVRISGNFQAGATHQDTLLIAGTTSGSATGISWNYNSATGVMTLSGPATVAEYVALLNQIGFRTSGDDITAYGAAVDRTISVSVFDGLLYSDEIHNTVDVTGINDAPVNTPGAAMNFSEDTTGNFGAEGVPPTAVSNAVTGISVFDVDANPATQDITVTLSVGVGTLTIRTDVVGGIAPANVISGNGTGTIVITATQNQINATLAAMSPAFTGPPAAAAAPNGLIYTPPANYNGATNLTITTNDNGFNGNDPGLTGGGTDEQDQDVKVINIADVNDAPTVGGDGTEAAATILEDTPFTNLNAPTVATLVGGQFADAIDIQVTGGNPTGSIGDTFAGIAIVADGSSPATGQWEYWNGAAWTDIGAASQAAARTFTAATQIRFNPAPDYNGAAPTLTVHLIETGGPAITNNGTVNLSPAGTATGGTTVYSSGTVVLSQDITPVNDAPTTTNIAGDTATYTEQQALAALLDVGSNATIGDVDSPNFDTGTLTVAITSGLVAAEDRLVIRLTGTVSFNATNVFVGGIDIGTYTGHNSSGPLVFTFNADATPARVAELIRAIAYNNVAGDDPTDGNRTITWTLVDGDGTLNTGVDTVQFTSTLDVDPVNDAPAGADETITIDEDGSHVFNAGNFNFTDPLDGDAFAGVVLTTLPALGDLYLNGVAITVAGTFVTIADINSGLLTYEPDPDGNGTGYATFTFQVRDNGGVLDGGVDTDPNPDTITFNVNAFNDAPVNTLGGTVTINEDAVNAPLTGMSIFDVDAGSDPITVILEVANGVLNISETVAGGLTAAQISNNGSGTVTIIASQSQINATFADAAGVLYTPNAQFNGDDTLTVTTNDGGATGADAALEDIDTRTITVNSVNDEPSGATNTVTASEDDPYVFLATDFGFTDPIDLDDFAGVVLTTLPVEGDLRLNGVNITVAGTFITAADIAGGLLTFLADPDEFGTGYASFTFQVRDDGGILNGGVDTDQTPNTMTINVTQDNIPPVVDLNSGTPGLNDTNLFVENGAASGIGTAITVSDFETDAIQSATVTITDSSAGDLLSVTLPLPPGITVDAVNSTATTLILIGSASASAYAAALGQVGYSNTGEDPTAGGNTDRVINVTVSDATGTSAPATMTMSILATNDAPTLTATGGTPTFTEGGAFVDLFSGVTASTIEAGQTFSALTLTVTNVTDGNAEILQVNGSDVLLVNGNAVNFGLGIANVTVVGTTATVVLSGMALTNSQLQTLVDGLAYNDNSENPTDANRVVTITQIVDSGANGGASVNNSNPNLSATVNVNPVNDAPVITPGTTSVTIGEDGSFTLSGAGSPSVSDADASVLTVTLGVAHGTLTIASTSGLSFSGGADGTNDAVMTFSGTAAAINAALAAGLTYNPNPDFNGSDPIQIQVTDNGQSGGPAQIDTDSISVGITAINDAPVVIGDGTEQAADIDEDVPGPGQTIQALFSGQYSDAADNQIPNGGASSPGQFSGIAVVANGSNPAEGQWQYFNGAIWVDIGPASEGAAILLGDPFVTLIRFNPTLDFYGDAPTLTVRLIDNSVVPAFVNGQVVDLSGPGATGGTTPYSSGTVVLSQYVIPDNFPPEVDLNGADPGINYTTTFVEDGTAVGIGSGITVFDADAIPLGDLIESATITLTDRVAGDSLILTVVLPGFSAVTTPAAGSITITITGPGTGAQYQSMLTSILYSTTNQDPTVGGTDPSRTIEVTVSDGDIASAVATATINITAVDDAPVAQPDAFTINENGSIAAGNLFANNGSGADDDVDGPPLAISAVNGSAGNVNNMIVLASGASLTVNSNGTFDYDPGTVFLPTPTLGSGASNTPGQDSFTYTLAGGNTVTVNITLTGLDTDDLLLGTAGADALIGGNGNDTYVVENASDQVIELTGQGFDAVLTSVSYALAAGTDVEWLSTTNTAGTDAINLTGNEIANYLIGNNGANMLDGGAGADVMIGFAGDDAYVVDDAADQAFENAGEGFDAVLTSVSYALAAGQSIEWLSTTNTAGTAAIDLTGNELANYLIGNNGANMLDGGAGADVMIGFAGDDVYVVDDASDLAFENAGEGFDAVLTSVSYALATGQDVEWLSTSNTAGTEEIDLNGNEIINYLIGNNGANTLDGGGGADWMIGFGGDDIYFVDDAGDYIGEAGGGGSDLAYASVSYALAAGQEVELLLAVSGTSAINLTGNELDNTIYGNDGANVLDGKEGDDTLVGLGGADVFAFTTALGAGNVDVVFGFQHGVDRIALDDAIFAALGPLGALDPSAFTVGNAATDGSDRIIYNNLTGQLFYDADGNGAGVQILFATMNPGLTLTASDFMVI